MSLLMEALRKAEAAKRAGLGAGASETDTAVPAVPEVADTPDDRPETPEMFKFTSADDLRALAPRDDEPAPAPAREIPLAAFPEQPPAPVSTGSDDVLDDYLTAAPSPDFDEEPGTAQTGRERIKIAQQRERQAAASMFNAKTPGPGKPGSRRRMQILTVSLISVAAIVGGTWGYLTNMPAKSGVGANQSVANYNLKNRGFLGEQPATGAAQPAPATAPAAAAPPASAPSPTNATAAAPVAAPAATPATPPPIAAAATTPAPATQPQASPTTPALAVADPQSVNAGQNTGNDTAADSAAVATPPLSPPQTLAISRTTASSRVNPELQSAYNQLQRGNLDAAHDLYQSLVTRTPNQRDALLGLAAAQLRLGRNTEARVTYATLLKLNPRDALARTGMLQTLPVSDPDAYEKELVALRTQFPDLAPLSLALGNHYARNSRWHEAQSAYFDALMQARRSSPDSVSPDYAFNLAVSLEQLGQKRAALEYYKQADTLVGTTKPGFDPQLLRQRLTELGQTQ